MKNRIFKRLSTSAIAVSPTRRARCSECTKLFFSWPLFTVVKNRFPYTHTFEKSRGHYWPSGFWNLLNFGYPGAFAPPALLLNPLLAIRWLLGHAVHATFGAGTQADLALAERAGRRTSYWLRAAFELCADAIRAGRPLRRARAHQRSVRSARDRNAERQKSG